MYSKKTIKVHVELSNICNAVCPQCLRNYIDESTGELSVKDALNTHELTIEDYRQIFDNEFFMWVIFAAISPGIIAFTLYTMAQKKLGASLTGFTLYVFTIYGAIYGYFLFEEKLEYYHYIGTVLVFFGVYLAKKKNVKKI